VKPEICARCGEEVRFGWRATKRNPVRIKDQGSWLHRDPDVDHAAILGQPMTPEFAAEIEYQLDLPRVRTAIKDGKEIEVVYTTRTWKQKKSSNSEGQGDDGKLDELYSGELPPVEVASHPLPVERSAVPAGVWNMIKPALAAGLQVVRLTHSRGPWLPKNTATPKVEDCIILSVRGESRLDDAPWAAVGCWRTVNGKYRYEYGFLLTGNVPERVTASDIKMWIKMTADAVDDNQEEPSGPDT
jgi:hypothetical protein